MHKKWKHIHYKSIPFPLLSTVMAAWSVNPKVHHSAPITSAATASQYSGSIIPYMWESLKGLINESAKETVTYPVLSGLRKWIM